MRTITIPATVEHIDLAFFQLFPNAASIAVAEGSQTYSSENGMLLDAAQTDLLLVPEGMEGKAVLPDTVATVPACVLSRCTKLSAMTADEAAGSTGHSALATVDGIIYSKDKTTLLAAPAGAGASVAIASECEAIAPGAFWGNARLKTIVATGAVGSIASGVTDAEGLCDALGIRAGAASSGSERADAEDSAAGDSPDVPIAAFDGTTIANATIVTSERAAWEAAGFAHFAEPAKPGDAAEQDGFAFTLLSDFTLAVSWADEAPAPEELAVPVTGMVGGAEYAVSTIERDAFKGQEGIRALAIPEGISSVGDAAFFGCAGLESAQLAGSVTSIGASAFQGCTELAAADLGGGVRTIGASAFEQTALPSAVLPASVQSIGERAFASDAALARIVALSDIPEVDATALADCTGVEIYAPYREDGAYAWAPGVPATGNHLMPYGVELASEPLVLGQGQSADLLEGGRLEAPGSVEVLCSYNASPISVDVASAQVSAKQTGKTTVTATLKLADAALASASRPVVVEAAPSEEVEKEEENEEIPPSEIVGENGETAEELKELHTPDIPYDEQFYREGDFFEGGIFEAQEKVINRTVALADMGISPMSLDHETATVGNYSKQVGTAAKGMLVQYTADTRTLTLNYTGGYYYDGHTSETASSGSTNRVWRLTNNRMLAIRRVVVNNMFDKNSEFVFANMPNLETIEFNGENRLGWGNETEGELGTARRMFWNCYSLRVFWATNIRGIKTSTEMFGFSSTYRDRLSSKNQLVNGKVLTYYSGNNDTIKSALNASSTNEIRQSVGSYYTVTFDNQGGSGGHQTVGESTSASNKTYTIKVPHGSPIPELTGVPSYSGWTFGGYVDASTSSAPKQYVSKSGYPYWSVASKSWMAITSSITLKALWYNKAEFYGDSEASSNGSVNLVKGNPINKTYSMTDMGDMSVASSNAWLGRVWKSGYASDSTTNLAPECTNRGRPFRGFTLGESLKSAYGFGPLKSVAWYGSDRNPSSQLYNEAKDFYGMWGGYTLSIYTSAKTAWNPGSRMGYNSAGQYDSSLNTTMARGESAAGYGSPYVVTDVLHLDVWPSYTVNTHERDADGYRLDSQTDYVCANFDGPGYSTNVRPSFPAHHEVKEIRLGDPVTGELVGFSRQNIFDGRYALDGNTSLYFILKDNTPNDTITWKANGGYLNGDTKVTETSNTAKRGTKVTAPAIARANSTDTRYTFLGWYSGDTKVCGAGGQVTANGAATYTAKWKTEYKITWNTGMSGAYWSNVETDTAAKEIWVESGKAVAAPTAPTKKATSDTRWTWEKWNTAPATPATGPATYTGVWKTEYKTVWKLGSTEAYWGTDKSDKNDKEKWFKSGDAPTDRKSVV